MTKPLPAPTQSIRQLAQAIREGRVILFVGAGVSMGVGLPSWQMLIDYMAEELGLPNEIVDAPHVTYLMLAEYYRLQQGSIGPLRSWMDRNWNVSPEAVRASKVHEAIVSLNFPIIYTTNFDRNLEVAFEVHDRPYVKVANARDVGKANNGVTQIVKFHGDFEEDESLVLTETDYFARLSFESPLDVKLRADALGRTILFVGYSMSDLNIRLLLHRVWETWQHSGYERDRPASYVFMPRVNVVQEALLNRWGITVLSADRDDPGEALGDFLLSLLKECEADEGTSPRKKRAR